MEPRGFEPLTVSFRGNGGTMLAPQTWPRVASIHLGLSTYRSILNLTTPQVKQNR